MMALTRLNGRPTANGPAARQHRCVSCSHRAFRYVVIFFSNDNLKQIGYALCAIAPLRYIFRALAIFVITK